MTQASGGARPAIVRSLWLTLAIALAAGCAENNAAPERSHDDNFEIRAMIASDREAIHAMDERMRRIEDQIQELGHGGGGAQAANPEAAGAPPRPAAPAPEAVAPEAPPAAAPPYGAPPAAGAPPGGTLPLGAPPAPGASAPAPESAPSAASVAPGAEPGAAAVPGNPAAGTPDDSDTSTIASTRSPGPRPAPPPPEEAGSAEAGDSGGGAPGEEAAPGASSEGTPPEGEGGAAEGGSAEGAAAPAGNPAAGNAPPGEEVASAPSAAVPENAPAASGPRWPQDLEQELNSPATAKGGAGKLFRSGLEAMKQRDYSDAVARFGTVQKKYPHSDLTEPAAYFSANALNEMGKYDQAILQYNDLVMRYPKGKYSSEALLREGQAFMQINDKIDARLTLQKLVSDHAGTPQAAEAGAMLKTLESDQ
jgi:tol-pal system protein YbgF